MRLRFTKMHGLGNDFVVIDGISQKVRLSPERVRQLADRHMGIGCDQVLLVEAPEHTDVDFRYRIFNADGNEVENCGNGARCFARFVRERKLTGRRRIRVETAAGHMELIVEDNDEVTVNMGAPELTPSRIPFQADRQATHYPLEVAGETHSIAALSMGNPHAVLRVDEVDTAPVGQLGPLIEAHPRFPQRVNVGFMQVLEPDAIRLRVYERGVGETLACGTGACAAVVAGIQSGWLNTAVTVHLRGGALHVRWPGLNQAVMMTGPAVSVFHGQIRL